MVSVVRSRTRKIGNVQREVAFEEFGGVCEFQQFRGGGGERVADFCPDLCFDEEGDV